MSIEFDIKGLFQILGLEEIHYEDKSIQDSNIFHANGAYYCEGYMLFFKFSSISSFLAQLDLGFVYNADNSHRFKKSIFLTLDNIKKVSPNSASRKYTYPVNHRVVFHTNYKLQKRLQTYDYENMSVRLIYIGVPDETLRDDISNLLDEYDMKINLLNEDI